jgi:colanic acid biosynthesis glycosyl transferase WcaI
LCDDLSSEHEITFVAGPSYHIATNGSGLIRRQQRGRVSIIRTWGTRLPKQRLPLRIMNLASYYVLAAFAASRVRRPDIIVAETDPPLLGWLGAGLKRRFGCRLVYNVRDLYPDIAYANGGVRNRFLLWLLEFANRRAYEAADRIIVLGEDMRQRVMRKGVPEARLTVLTDWVDCAQIQPVDDSPFRRELGESFVVMYSGNLGLSQQLETVIEAAHRLRDDQRIVFVLIGEGARKQWLMNRAAELRLPNVRFMPYRPKEQLAESLGAADIHLVPLFPGAAGCIVPSKIYGILAAGRPFVAIMESDAAIARLACEHSIGFVAPPGDSEKLASVVRQAADQRERLREMGRRARKLAETHFDRKVLTRRFGEVLSEVGNSPITGIGS